MTKTDVSYTVRYRRDETGRWLASVAEIPDCAQRGRSIRQARSRICDALARLGAKKARIVDVVQLSDGLSELADQHRAAREQLELCQAKAQEAMLAAVAALERELGLSTRDVATVLGLSHQRVQQVTAKLKSPKRAPAQRRTVRRAR